MQYSAKGKYPFCPLGELKRFASDAEDYTEGEVPVAPIGILILDDDSVSHAALEQVLDSEGWQISVQSRADKALAELAKGNIRLVIANVAMAGLAGPVFEILRELAQAPAVVAGGARARVLFLVPRMAATEAQPQLEQVGLP
ncbi:MAG: response regulator, partial [Bryobacteraceae bacterium]